MSVTNIHSVFPSSVTVSCPGGLTTGGAGVTFDLGLTGAYYIQVDGNNSGTGVPTGSVNVSWTK